RARWWWRELLPRWLRCHCRQRTRVEGGRSCFPFQRREVGACAVPEPSGQDGLKLSDTLADLGGPRFGFQFACGEVLLAARALRSLRCGGSGPLLTLSLSDLLPPPALQVTGSGRPTRHEAPLHHQL